MTNSNGDRAPEEKFVPRPAVKAAPLRALVVDADRYMSEALERVLENHGYGVFSADSAASAMDMTRRLQPDLILLDSGVCVADHAELLDELLIEQASAAVLVVARSPSIAEAVHMIKVGALDYLERPLDLKKVEQVLANQQAWRADAPHGA